MDCKFFRIDPDEEDFDIFRAINQIFRHIKQSTKKTLVNKISVRLLGLEFKWDNILKTKAMKFIVKKTCLIISNIYCVSCKKNTAKEKSSFRKNKQNRLMLLSHCVVCGKKKSTFIKNQELHNFNNI